MSRIGKKPISIPAGVKVEVKGRIVKMTGALGTSEFELYSGIKAEFDDSAKELNVISEDSDSRQSRQMHGTTRALLANMVVGVSKGFSRKMQIFGTGFGVNEQGGKLVFQVGYCNAVELKIPQGVKVNIEVKATKGNDIPAVFTLSSMDKCVLGGFAAQLRKIRPPEPYKGKGIRYADEHVRRKVGKALTSGAA